MLSTKNLLLALTLFTVAVGVNLFLPLAINAEGSPTQCKMHYTIPLGDLGTCSKGEEIKLNDDRAICCLLNAIYSVRDWLFYILLTVAAIFFIIAGYHFLSAAGDPAKITAARLFVLYALIGVLVALLARGFVVLVQKIILG